MTVYESDKGDGVEVANDCVIEYVPAVSPTAREALTVKVSLFTNDPEVIE